MILFPNAKINIGLYVTEKRPDGFHNIETVFFPTELSDILEIKTADAPEGTYTFKNSGLQVDCPDEKNLVIKAYKMLADDFKLPAVNIHLHKIIPFGAGLGGGSSDAAFTLKGLNEKFNLGLDRADLETYASRLGSDCAFFIRNRAAFASGKGEILEDIDLDLNGWEIRIEKPDVSVSTGQAYGSIIPSPAPFDLRKLQELPIEEWRNCVFNDFEKSVFPQFPEIEALKRKMYTDGAAYAAMSGSGSAVFGLFRKI